MFNELLKERLLDAHLEFFGKDKKKFLIHRILYAVVVTMLYTMIIMVIKKPILLIGLLISNCWQPKKILM